MSLLVLVTLTGNNVVVRCEVGAEPVQSSELTFTVAFALVQSYANCIKRAISSQKILNLLHVVIQTPS